MYIYRAINELDEKLNPKENGLIAKSFIDQVIRNDFDFLIYATFLGKENPTRNMKESEIKELYHEIRKKFEVNMHTPEILSIVNRNQEMINNIFKRIILNEDSESMKYLIDILSTKNSHISNGSTNDYPWISFSKDLEAIKHYYENQEKNLVVVVDSNINKFFDTCDSDFLLALDLSSDEIIKDNEFIINANKIGTSLNYRGLNYAKKSKEVIYYNRVPKEKIVTILSPLQYELFINGLLDDGYFKIPEYKKRYWKLLVLNIIKSKLQDKGEIIEYILDEHYTKDNSLKSLSERSKYSLYDLNKANKFIIEKVKQDDKIREKILLR